MSRNRPLKDIVKDKYEQAKCALVPFEYNDVGWAVLLLENLYDDYKETLLPALKNSNLEKVYIKNDYATYQAIRKNYTSDLKEIANLSRLYSFDKYEDFLVISNEKGDSNFLTFEEIIGDKVDWREFYNTQVIHLEYKLKAGKYFVNHLDHEFVFYSQEDFNKKLYDNRLKGNARERIKTFKIDNANIELTNETSTNIIFRTIHAYFKRHDLVDEYFTTLNKSCDR